MICRCNKNDVDFLINLAVECYPAFDVESSRKWLGFYLERPDILCFKGDSAAALAFINSPFWSPKEKNCELSFICSRKTTFGAVELLKILSAMNKLRKEHGCDNFYWNSRLSDLSPFARRLGAKQAGQMWVIN